jgi:Saxitoxin biosynthesis operon protein SxtJ
MLIQPGHRPSDRQLRWFAGLWFPAMCGVIGAAVRAARPNLAVAVWAIGAVVSMSGLVRPAIVRPVYATLMWVTFPIAWIMSHAILALMYFVIITPVALVVRLFYDPLTRRFDREASSYWTPRTTSEPSRYFRQF